MERAEKIGLGVATAGHVLLFGLLSAGFLTTPNPLKLNSPPMDVSLVDEVALKSMAPQLSTEPPPPSVAPEEGPTEDAAPAPLPEPRPEPEPAPAPSKPKPAPPKKDVARAAPKPKPAEKPAARKPTPEKPKPAAAIPAKSRKSDGKAKSDAVARGSLLGKDFLKGIDTESEMARKPTRAPAAAIGPVQKAALDAEIRRQLKPYWRPPSGADADQLVSLLEVRLDRQGSVIGTPQLIDQLGVTASNRPQAQLHAERAIQAVKLASPFRNLPPEFYDQWKWLKPLRFDARLNR